MFIAYFNVLIKLQLIYNVPPISAVHQSDPKVNVGHILFLIFSSIMLYQKRLDIVHCDIQVVSHCFSILSAIVCISSPQNPTQSHSLSLQLSNHKSLLHVCESVFVLQIGSFVPYFSFHIKVIHMVFVLLFLTYFTQYENLQLHPCCF